MSAHPQHSMSRLRLAPLLAQFTVLLQVLSSRGKFRQFPQSTFQTEKKKPSKAAMLLDGLTEFAPMVQTQIAVRLEGVLAAFRHWYPVGLAVVALGQL